MRSVMSHNFSQVPAVEIPRSSFDRSHGLKTTFDSGYLVPVYVDEALPGDTFNLNLTSFARMATPIFPVMDNMSMDFFFFAVPLRLVWDNFERFMGFQKNPGDSTSFLVPQMVSPAGGYTTGSLSDYLGLPISVAGLTHSSLWHRAYNLIWNEWFRDQNMQNSVVVDTGDGPDTYSNYTLLRRGKRHDYFTSALPWPQKGSSVSLPLGTTAPVLPIGNSGPIYKFSNGVESLPAVASGSSAVTATVANAGSTSAFLWKTPNLQADLSAATAATINQLRQAFAIQKLLERDARGGTRYVEVVKSHFGVTSPDARLQRPEYLGGGSAPVNVSPIAQTAPTQAGVSPQGNLAAMATARASVGFTKSFTEHCVLIGLANVRCDLTYQQGMNRMFSRSTRVDFYWPALSQIGEQAILNKEIYAQGTAVDDQVFGYQERFAEYRYKPSQITGKFRSTASGTLDSWHLSQKFVSLPTLGDTFIKDIPPISRVIAVPTQPEFIYDSYVSLRCVRPMPVYGVPGMGDRF